MKDDSNKAQRALRVLRDIRKERRAAEESTERASAKIQQAALEQANFDEDNMQREKAGPPLVEGLNLLWWHFGGTIGEELVKNKAQLDLREIRGRRKERRDAEGPAADTDISEPEAKKPGQEQRTKTPETTEEELNLQKAMMDQVRLEEEKKDREAKEAETASKAPPEPFRTDLPNQKDSRLPKQPGAGGTGAPDSSSPPQTDPSAGPSSPIASSPPPVSGVPDAKRVDLVFLRRNETGFVDVRYLALPFEEIRRLHESRLDRFDFRKSMPLGFLQQLSRLSGLPVEPPHDEDVDVDAEGRLRGALVYQLRKRQDKEIKYPRPIWVQLWLRYNRPGDPPNAHQERFSAEMGKQLKAIGEWERFEEGDWDWERWVYADMGNPHLRRWGREGQDCTAPGKWRAMYWVDGGLEEAREKAERERRVRRDEELLGKEKVRKDEEQREEEEWWRQEDLRWERETQERLRREKEEADAHLRPGKRGPPSGEGDKTEREHKRTKSNVEDDEALARRLQKELEEQELQNRGFPVDVDVNVKAQLAALEQIRLEKEKRDRIAKAEEAAAQAASRMIQVQPAVWHAIRRKSRRFNHGGWPPGEVQIPRT